MQRNIDLSNRFPEAIDSTILASYGNCPTSFKLGYVDNWKPATEQTSVHLHAGGAFAAGLEGARRAFYVHGLPAKVAEGEGLAALLEHWGDYEPAFDTPKTLDRMCGALEFYFHEYPLETDRARLALLGERHGVEFSFAIPLPINHPQTGEPLLFCGRCDAIVNFAGGLYAMDEKTTSSLGSSWSKQWDLRSQFSGYAWAMKQLGYPPAGTIVRGISILKTKYETQESIIPQPGWKLDRWYQQMLIRIQDMITAFQEDKWRMDLGEACNHYGGCSYKQCCLAPDPEPWLTSFYRQEVWSPLERVISINQPERN